MPPKKNVNNELARILARRRAHVNRFVTNNHPRNDTPRPRATPPKLTQAQVAAFWRELEPLLASRRRLANR